MYRYFFLFLVLSLSSCSLMEDDGIPSKNHIVSLKNSTSLDVYVEFSTENRWGTRVPKYTIRDSTFSLPAGESFTLINDGYSPRDTEPAYAHYHTLEEIERRIILLDVYIIENNDTIRPGLDLLNEDRWYKSDNDPITFEETYHYYLYSILDSDF